MARGATRRPTGRHPPREDDQRASGEAAFGGWEQRVYSGLLLNDIATDVREALARALGAAGVEAEHLLRVLAIFPGADGFSPASGAHLLDQLQAFARRFLDTANGLELATQSFLTALQSSSPSGLPTPLMTTLATPVDSEPWWPPFAGYTLGGEPIELRLRRCGYSYQLAVTVRLGATVEALAEQLALLLHALSTLPPAGTVSTAVLARGLDELANAMQGDVAQHLLRDVDEGFPGLLTAVERLRVAAPDDATAARASLAADLAWARGEYERVVSAGASVSARAAKPGLLARLFGAPRADASQRWSQSAAREWRELIASLEAL